MGIPFQLHEIDQVFPPKVLMEGEDLWLDGALVGLEEYRNTWSAKVYAGKIEQVSLKVRGKEVIAVSCTCAVKGLCAHVAALALPFHVAAESRSIVTLLKIIKTIVAGFF